MLLSISFLYTILNRFNTPINPVPESLMHILNTSTYYNKYYIHLKD